MRVKTGFSRRRHHKKVLNRTKGFRMTKGRLFKVSHEADMHSGQYAFAGRRLKRRDLRKLWIIRINSALHTIDGAPRYSQFINLLKAKNVELDRKILADLAATDLKTFTDIVNQVKAQ
jgi:large subunit ribosomal protein L20